LETVLILSEEGQLPDVIFVEVNIFFKFLPKDMLMNLSELIASDNSFNLDSYYPNIVKRFTANGKIYVIPRDTAPICCVYYNKDLFDKAGIPYPEKDWQWPRDFLPTAQKLTTYDKNGRVKCFGFIDDQHWQAYILSNGGEYMDNIHNPTRITLDSPACIAGIQFRQDLIHKYKVMPSASEFASLVRHNGAESFAAQKTAMFLGGIWKTPFFTESIDFDWDIALFPQGPAGPRRFHTGGSGYGISKSTKHTKEAWQLVKFLAGQPGQIELAMTGLAQPADQKIANSRFFLNGKNPKSKGLLLEAAKHIEYDPYHEIWNKFLHNYLYPGLNEVWSGKASAETVLKTLVKRANQELFK